MTHLQKFGYAFLASLLSITGVFAEGFDFKQSEDAKKDVSYNFSNEDKALPEVIKDYITYILGFITLIAVIYALWAGWNIMTAGGDEEKVKKGRTTIIQIAIGIIVMWLAYTIVSFVISSID